MARPHDTSVEERLARLERMVEEIHRRLPAPYAAPAAPGEDAASSLPADPLAAAAWDASTALPADQDVVEPEPAFAAVPAGADTDDPAWDGVDEAPPVRERGPIPRYELGPYVERRPAAVPGFAAVEGLKGMDAQFWLNRLGIGILLLGVAFLFRYSIEQGWVTPERRVAFGGLVGVGLLAAGLRMDETRRRFVPVLLGGGIATFYIVGFAAFYLYELIGYGAAFAGMVGVTALAFGLALRKAEPSLGVLGALGGLGTPLVLGISHGTPLGFSLYVSALLSWTCALYLLRGWKPVLWTSLAGGWLLLLTYSTQLAALGAAAVPAAALWALQGAIVFAWLGTGVLPFVRELRVKARALAAAGAGEAVVEEAWDDRTLLHWHGLALLPPLLALGVTGVVWEPSAERWGVMALALAGAYQLASLALRARDEHLPDVLTLSASLFLALGSFAAFSGNVLLLVLAVEGVGLVALGRRHSGRLVTGVGYVLFGSAALWTALRLANPAEMGPREPFVDLAVILLAVVLPLVDDADEAVAARYFAHFAFLGWLWRDLAAWTGTDYAATAAWAAYGAGLFALARRRGWGGVEVLAAWMAPLLAGKLLLVDLAPALGGEGVLLCLVVQALLVADLARRYHGSPLTRLPVVLYFFAAFWTSLRLMLGDALGESSAAVDLAVVGTGLALSYFEEDGDAVQRVYRYFAHFAWMAWLWRELTALPEGQAYATVAWAVYGVGLIVVGMRRPWPAVERLGILTLLLVVAKLFLVDLAALEAIWRVLLFLGVGGGFLFLSYWLQSARRAVAPAGSIPSGEAPLTGAGHASADGG